MSIVNDTDQIKLYYSISVRDQKNPEIAIIDYFYVIKSYSTLINLEVLLKPVGQGKIENIEIEIIKNLQQAIKYSKVCYKAVNKSAECTTIQGKTNNDFLFKGIEWLRVIEKDKMGFSYALHTFPKHQAFEALSLELDSSTSRVISISSKFKIKNLQNNEIVNITESSLLTSGGLYKTMDKYPDLFRDLDKRHALTDYRIS